MTKLLAALMALTLLPACNTVAGAGKDVSALGRGITHVATEVNDEVFQRDRRTYPAEVRYRQPVATVGQACDPNASELYGGNGLPPCPSTAASRQSVTVYPGRGY